ncbi:hypothetical protein Tco_1456036 [Tanacetum coccineum]
MSNAQNELKWHFIDSSVKSIRFSEGRCYKIWISYDCNLKESLFMEFQAAVKNVQCNSVQAVDAILGVTKSSGIESENNSSENALSKSVNETHMQMQEGKVDMGKALDVGYGEETLIAEEEGIVDCEGFLVFVYLQKQKGLVFKYLYSHRNDGDDYIIMIMSADWVMICGYIVLLFRRGCDNEFEYEK